MMLASVKKWVIKALEDWRLAQQGLNYPPAEIATGPICFLCQQAVEKLLKAYLVSRKIDFERTHDLEFLRELCAREDAEFRDLNLGNLKFYAVEVRYADEFYMPAIEEAQEAFKIAGMVKEFVFKKLGVTDSDLRDLKNLVGKE